MAVQGFGGDQARAGAKRQHGQGAQATGITNNGLEAQPPPTCSCGSNQTCEVEDLIIVSNRSPILILTILTYP